MLLKIASEAEMKVLIDLDVIKRLIDAAESVASDCEDEIDYFKVPSHRIATLAVCLDDLHAELEKQGG